MKRGTIDHPKVKKLARLLNVPRYAAVGLLESLWHFASRYAPAGDVGRFDDAEIADHLDWMDEAVKLINAMVESRWIDRNETHRLVIHDWAEHADDAVHQHLARATKHFADGSRPRIARLTVKEREKIEAAYDAAEIARQAHKKQELTHASTRQAHDKHTECTPPKPLPEPKPEPSSGGSPQAADDGEAGEPLPTDPSVFAIPAVMPPPDPLMGEASRLIGTLTRSFEINRRDRQKVCELIRKFGAEQVGKAFEECNAHDALKPVTYATTVLTNWQAIGNRKAKPPDEHVFSDPNDEKLDALEKAGVL